MTLSILKWNHYRRFCIWSSQGSGWLLWISKVHRYCSVPIHEEYQKYLKFLWEYPLKFINIPNGYGPAMRAFTKRMKPPFSFLRPEGYLSVNYISRQLLSARWFVHKMCRECYIYIRTIEILEGLMQKLS